MAGVKQLTLIDIEECLEEIWPEEERYPKKMPNGMCEIAKGVITDERGLELFHSEIVSTKV